MSEAQKELARKVMEMKHGGRYNIMGLFKRKSQWVENKELPNRFRTKKRKS
ncbi:hypothetical protein EVB94_064 [Rhizobium phage RHph_TM40]|nr:hypothetical protein EVB94_064 [Rhizobium phage RHph_TM40]QIG72260.1 hypothetical protein EVB96_064 [Rhizobium phage RHph_TM3_3_6]